MEVLPRIKSVLFGMLIVCFLFFVLIPQFFRLYAKEGRKCCFQSECDFGYTCLSIPSPCPKIEKYGSCTQSIIECPNGYGCPAGMYCVDYVCVGFGPGTPTPGGGSYEYQMRHEFANSWTLAARNCAIIFATARS